MRALPAAVLIVLAGVACLCGGGRACAADFPVVVAGGDQSAPDVARAGGGFLVVWQDDRNSATTGRDVYAARVSGSGAVLDPAGIAVSAASGPQECPRVASDGDGFLVVWQDDRDENSIWQVRAARVTAEGGTPDGEGVVVAGSVANQPYPNVAWTGSHYLVAWQGSGAADVDVYFARVGADGVLMDDPPVVADDATYNQDSISLAAGNGKTLLTYRECAPDLFIKGVFVDSGGTPSSPFTIANAPGTQKSPAVAFGDGLFLVAWEDWRDGNPDIYAARVQADGTVLDLGAAAHIAVAVVSDDSRAPSVTFDGAAFAVAWEDDRNVATGFDIYRARVSAAGGITDPAAPLYVGDADQLSASVQAGSPEGFFAWTDHRHEATTAADIYARFDEAPVASASFSPPTPSEGGTVTLDATASYDPEGATLSYFWAQVSGPDVGGLENTLVAPAFVAPESDAPYDLVFSLVVSDGCSWSFPYQVTVGVDADEDPPVAVAGDVSAGECEVVTLDGNASYDPEGGGLTFLWEQQGTPVVSLDDATSVTPSFTAPDLTGDYTLLFTLTVNDGTQDCLVPAAVTVSVAAADDPPVADAGEQIAVQSGTPVTLDGTRSSDPEGGPLAGYSWVQDWGPGVTLDDSNSATPSFTAPDAAGEVVLAFTLTVTDGGGKQDSDQTQVWVSPDELPAPVGSGFHVEDVTPESATVVWTTGIAATGRVEYGTTPALGSESDEEATPVTSHTVALVDLRAGATYYYTARSTGAGGAWSVSDVYELTLPLSSDDGDDDGIPDAWEDDNGLDSGNPSDALADPDHDGLTNLEEYRHGTDRDQFDTDSDGFGDGYEVRHGTSPLRSDSVPPPRILDDDSCGAGTPGAVAFLLAVACVCGLRRAQSNRGRHGRGGGRGPGGSRS